jgi:hypothetical protein
MIFTRPKRRMNSSLFLVALLLIGFLVYFFFRDYLFDPPESFQAASGLPSAPVPAPATITVRQAPVYPERSITPSGPSPPSQGAPEGEEVVYGPPQASDPYQETQESSDIPEQLRHPERAYRPAPSQEHTSIAVQAGLASHTMDNTSDAAVSRSPDMIQNGGEFMSGVFANDTFSDTNFSMF